MDYENTSFAEARRRKDRKELEIARAAVNDLLVFVTNPTVRQRLEVLSTAIDEALDVLKN